MTRAEVRELQKDLNRFSGKFLTKYPKLMVDGDRGHATNRRIQTAKWYLGYTGKPQRSARLSPQFRRRLDHPKDSRFAPADLRKRGEDRRREQRREAKSPPTHGVTTFDGRKVAAWLVPYLEYARAHGWRGTLNSGWRDPVYSEHLCIVMCGATSCPGRCAGRASNHSGSVMPHGALDVSDYVRFGQLMRQMPLKGGQPRIFNALGAQDPVHYSASGR